MMRGGRGGGRSRGGGARGPPPPRRGPSEDHEEGEVLSPSPSTDEHAAPYSSYASMASRLGRGGGRSSQFRGGGGGRGRFGRGGRGRFESRGGGRGGPPPPPQAFRSDSRGADDDGNSFTGGSTTNAMDNESYGRGGGRGRVSRGGRPFRGRSYMMTSRGRGRSNIGDWNMNSDTGSVSSASGAYEGRGRRGRGSRGGRSFGRGRSGGGRGRCDSSTPYYGKRRRDDDNRSLDMDTSEQTKRFRDSAPSFGSEGEIFGDEEFNRHASDSYERQMSGSADYSHEPRSNIKTDHPGLDRPLSEGRGRGGGGGWGSNSWDERSASQDNSTGGRRPMEHHHRNQQSPVTDNVREFESSSFYKEDDARVRSPQDHRSQYRHYSQDDSFEKTEPQYEDDDHDRSHRHNSSERSQSKFSSRNDGYSLGKDDPSDRHSTTASLRAPPPQEEQPNPVVRGDSQSWDERHVDQSPREFDRPETNNERRYDRERDYEKRSEREAGVSSIFRPASGRSLSASRSPHVEDKDRYSSSNRNDWTEPSTSTPRSNYYNDPGSTLPRDSNRRIPPPTFRQSRDIQEDRRRPSPIMQGERRDYQRTPPGRYHSETQSRPSLAAFETSKISTAGGYAALANLPGPMASPRVTKPPPPPLTAQAAPAKPSETTTVESTQVASNSPTVDSQSKQNDEKSTRVADLHIDAGRSESFADSNIASSYRDSFSKPSASPRIDAPPHQFGTFSNEPRSPSPRNEFGINRSGYDGPRSQAWGGRGRGRGRGFGRGDFSQMDGRGPRPSDSLAYGDMGVRGPRPGDMIGAGDRLVGRQSIHSPVDEGHHLATDSQARANDRDQTEIDATTDSRASRGSSVPMDSATDTATMPDSRSDQGVLQDDRLERSSFISNTMPPDGARPVDPQISSEPAAYTGGSLTFDGGRGGGRAPYDSFRGRGRGPYGRIMGRGRGRDFTRGGRGRGGRGWDQGGRVLRPWEPRVALSQQPPHALQSSLPPPPPPVSPPPFAALADMPPDEAFRRRTSNESGPKPSIPPPPHQTPAQMPTVTSAEVSAPRPIMGSFVDMANDTRPKPKPKPPSPPPGPPTPPPSEPSGLVLSLTRLADMEEELNFAYARHMKLMARQTRLRESYKKLESYPVGLEAIEEDLKKFMAEKGLASES